MTKRVLGVLAALTMVAGSVACSSSSSSGGTPTADTGKADTGPIKVVEGGADAPEEITDKTTGKTCTTQDDCDVTGNGVAYCTANVFVVGPLNPTPICMQLGQEDVCVPTDDTTIRFCDSGTGLCTKSGDNTATCDAMCQFDSTGKYLDGQACAGKNACNAEVFGTDPTSMKIVGIGTCQGGCEADADCPANSKCDPLQKFCTKTCTSDTACKTGWTGAPATWVCDVNRGACTFKYPKAVGDACATADDCLCFKNTADAGGYCIGLCKTGGAACGSGFTCDAILPVKDDKGADIWSFTSGQPAGLGGYCLKNCTADTDCVAGQACEASAGLTQKTCRPKSAAM